MTTTSPDAAPDRKKPFRIIFMGTPEFAVASLDALVEAGHHIVAVVTAPDRPAGRGLKLNESAVKKYAVEKGLTILQPEKLKNPEFIAQLRSFKADLQVIVAFRMLPEIVWNMPPMGSINVHASLLPKYRGAAPINWAVINGEKETGVTTFKLSHAIDTGNILLQSSVSIGESETAGELHDELKVAGAMLLKKTLEDLADGSISEQPQDVLSDDIQHAPHAPKIFTDTCKIDFSKTTDNVFNLIRGLSPFPGAFAELEGKTVKIFSGKKEIRKPDQHPGVFFTDKKSFLKFACADGYLEVIELQMEGKKRMGIEEFLRGYRFQ